MTDETFEDQFGAEDGPESDSVESRLCSICHQPTVGEQCGFCGNELCPACFEMGGGFCDQPHTQEQIDAYEDACYPPENAAEAEQRRRQRKARDELKAQSAMQNQS